MRLEASIDTLKGIGEKTAMLLHKLNIFTVGDMLRHYPFSYDSFQKAVTVSELKEGELCAFQAKLISRVSVRHVKNLSISTVKAADMTGEIGLTFFNMPYLQKTLKPGTFYVFRGRPVRKGKQLRMEHPAIYKPDGSFIGVNDNMALGDEIIINTNRGEKGITKNGANILSKIMPGSTFIQLETGDNELTINSDGETEGNVYFTLSFKRRFV